MDRKLKYYYANRDAINENKRHARRNATIDDVIRLRKQLYARSLADKIAKDTTQFNFREAYKPLLEGQTAQTKEITKTQKETSEEQLQQQRDLQDEALQMRHDQLLEEIKKQPLIIPLIKSLNKNPKVVDVINGKSDGSDLSGKERHVLGQLNKVDDRVLRTLIDFYSAPAAEVLNESGIASTGELTKSKLEMSEALRKQQEEGKSLYDYLIGLGPRISKETTTVFNKQENKDNFIQYLDSIGFKINLSTTPFKTIKTVHPDFYNEIQQLKKQKTGKGGGNIKFLSSDPQELINKLTILIAEKQAGNSNVFNEISAIVDELRRLGHLTIDEIKELYRIINK